MTSLQQVHTPSTNYGLDILENLADKNGWILETLANGDLFLESKGDWCTYGVQFTWSEEYQTLHLTCSLDMNLPSAKGAQINDLLAAINAKLWIGHFAVMSEGLTPAFRHTLLMNGPETIKSREVEDILEIALGECDRFYPAFQFAAFQDMTAEQAMTCALWDCVGEA